MPPVSESPAGGGGGVRCIEKYVPAYAKTVFDAPFCFGAIGAAQ